MNRITSHPVFGERTSHDVVTFVFDGQEVTALDGESVATALKAHGIAVLRTMPETGSPRSLFCGVGRCPDCMMTIDGVLNVRACLTTVRDGMVVETQHGLGTWAAKE